MKDLEDIAKLYLEGQEYDKAISCCQNILGTDKCSTVALKVISSSLLSLKRTKEARLYLQKAHLLNPLDPEVTKDIGKSYQLEGKNVDAEKWYLKTLASNPYYAPALTNLGVIDMSKKIYKDALKKFYSAIKADPYYATAWINISKAYEEMGTEGKALSCAYMAVSLSPNMAISHLNLGSILKEKDCLEEAELHTRRAIELAPNLAEAHFNLGTILQSKGKYPEAIIALTKVIELDPNFTDSPNK